MANNRLFIKDTQTGESLMIAKSNGDGWGFSFWDNDNQKRLNLDEANEWLRFSNDPYKIRDFECQYGSDKSKLKLLTEQELIENE